MVSTDSERIYFRAASQKQYEAIHHLAKAFNCSASQICRIAMDEWLRENFIKQLEFAQAVSEINDSTI
tara:strand:+ start:902 stop:1105 length:204 start_codon:yes stop_codon:yes gene_type:complete